MEHRSMIRINPRELSDNVIQLIGFDWMLVSAGSSEKFNTMTASWGGIGYLWNKPVAFVFIRPERYTREFVEHGDYLTLSFFDEQYRSALTLCGKQSGRHSDKVREAGLTPLFTELGNPTFEQARLVMECRKLYRQQLTAESFIDTGIIDRWYGPHEDGLHHLYVVELVNIWGSDSSL